MEKWHPINYEGSIYDDPRMELLARARRAQRGGDPYVAIPVNLALACAELRECRATTTMKVSYEPGIITLVCRLPENHTPGHFNGTIHWED